MIYKILIIYFAKNIYIILMNNNLFCKKYIYIILMNYKIRILFIKILINDKIIVYI